MWPPARQCRSGYSAGGVEITASVMILSTHEVDRAYGALGSYVVEHALGVDGPLREFYPVGVHETDDQTLWRTEIGWPIFRTGADRSTH
jgi:effector-binding domain-containing protein